jgi:hypothetical protein
VRSADFGWRSSPLFASHVVDGADPTSTTKPVSHWRWQESAEKPGKLVCRLNRLSPISAFRRHLHRNGLAPAASAPRLRARLPHLQPGLT